MEDINNAISLAINELIKSCISNDSITNIVKFGNKYRSIFKNERVFDCLLNFAKRTHDFSYLIKYYGYTDEIVDAIIASSSETKDYSFVIRCFKQLEVERYSRSYKNHKKITKYLLSAGKSSEVKKFLEKDHFSNDDVLIPYLEYCAVNNNEQEIADMIAIIKKLTYSYYKYLKMINKEKLFNVIRNLNASENDIWYFAILLFLESDEVLSEYQSINFEQNPEVSLSLKSKSKSYETNYPKFYASIKKIIKSGKPILALYILNKYGGYSSQSDIKLWLDSYVEAFVVLEKVDILAKYYADFVISSQNIELLQSIAQYYIQQKNPQKALTVIDDMAKLEPTYPFIQTAKHEIERLTMMEELSQNDFDINSINSLSGEYFENLLIQKFEQLGFKVTETPKNGDFGADIIVDTKDETRFVIQCKRFKNKVNLKAVQEVVGALPHYNGDIGIVITNSAFLSSAIKLAESNDIELWDNLKLMKFLTGDISFSQLSEL